MALQTYRIEEICLIYLLGLKGRILESRSAVGAQERVLGVRGEPRCRPPRAAPVLLSMITPTF